MTTAPHILIAIPYEPARAFPWDEVATRLAVAMMEACPEHTYTLALHPTRREHRPGDGPYAPHARARNSLLELWLDADQTHVLWLDSDLIAYPVDLPRRLLALCPDGIAAPAVTLDAPGEPHRFYDVGGFIEGGRWASMAPPWFAQPGPVVELESVGCCYLAPAWLYRDGARYGEARGRTEHEGVMAAARAAGLRICADLSMRAVHAWLPDYGEALH